MAEPNFVEITENLDLRKSTYNSDPWSYGTPYSEASAVLYCDDLHTLYTDIQIKKVRFSAPYPRSQYNGHNGSSYTFEPLTSPYNVEIILIQPSTGSKRWYDVPTPEGATVEDFVIDLETFYALQTEPSEWVLHFLSHQTLIYPTADPTYGDNIKFEVDLPVSEPENFWTRYKSTVEIPGAA